MIHPIAVRTLKKIARFSNAPMPLLVYQDEGRVTEKPLVDIANRLGYALGNWRELGRSNSSFESK
jgi:hypothetical protein